MKLRLLWVVFGAALALSVAVEPFIESEGRFAIEAVFAFGAWYGFLSCAGLILLAKAIGALLKRPDDYYEHD